MVNITSPENVTVYINQYSRISGKVK